MRFLKVVLFFTSVLILGIAPVRSQEGTCPDVVRRAIEATDAGCADTGRNQACYGNSQIMLTALEGITDLIFEHVGDIADIADIQDLQLSAFNPDTGDWGVALLRVQANIPDTIPGQNVTMLLLGDVQIQDARTNVNVSGDFGPMQAFYFRTGVGDAGCAEMPNSGIVVQTPAGVGEIALNINGVDFAFGSTAHLFSLPSDTDTPPDNSPFGVALFDGSASFPGGNIQPGFVQPFVWSEDDGGFAPSGNPYAAVPPSANPVPLNLLPDPVETAELCLALWSEGSLQYQVIMVDPDDLETTLAENPGSFAIDDAHPVTACAVNLYTVCHVTQQDGEAAHYVILRDLPYSATFGPGGHFDESGTPLAGHENDFLIESPSQEALCAPTVAGDAVVNTASLNVRAYPGTGAPIVASVPQGTPLEVIGRLSDNSWLQVITPDQIQGWVFAQLLQINVDLSAVSVIAVEVIHPTDTPSPVPNISFVVDWTTITCGNCVFLQWDVTSAAAVYFQHNPVAASGGSVECPSGNTTYVLAVTGLDGIEYTQSIDVAVVEPVCGSCP